MQSAVFSGQRDGLIHPTSNILTPSIRYLEHFANGLQACPFSNTHSTFTINMLSMHTAVSARQNGAQNAEKKGKGIKWNQVEGKTSKERDEDEKIE